MPLRPDPEPDASARDELVPNSTADVWTFKIRQGVKFHNGAALTADDVVYTFQLHTNTKNGSNSLSALPNTVLKPSGVVKVDDFTVAFHLEAPNGNFPYLVSSDNYNVIIIPKGYNPASWQSSLIGTGPFVLGSYTPKSGATFTRNESYWGTKALPSQTQFTFYGTQAASVLALTGGTIDVVGRVFRIRRPGAAQRQLQHHQAEVQRAP